MASKKQSAFTAMGAFANAMEVPILDKTVAASLQNKFFTITQLRALLGVAGSDREIQFNNSGEFGASDNLSFVEATDSILDVNSAANDAAITFSEAGTPEFYIGHDQGDNTLAFGTGGTIGTNLKLDYDIDDDLWDFHEIDIQAKRIFLEFSSSIEGSLSTAANQITLAGVGGTTLIFDSGGATALTLGTDQIATFASYITLFITDDDGAVEGSLWYDASEDKLKFKTAAGVETITSA